MSLTATWIAIGWTVVGAATASATQKITTKHLTDPTAPRTAFAAMRATIDGAPRPPPTASKVGQTVVTAALFGLLAWRFHSLIEVLAYSYLAALAVPLSVIDIVKMRLPRQLVLPMYPACVALFALASAASNDGPRFARALAGMAVLLLAYVATAVLSRGGLGAGDVRACGPIGLALTWLGWPTLLAGTLYTLLLFSVVAASTKDASNSFLRQELPFGPAMFSGAFLAILTPH